MTLKNKDRGAVKAILLDLGNVLVTFDERKDVLDRIARGFGSRKELNIFQDLGEVAYESIDTGTISHEDIWKSVCEQSGLSPEVLPLSLFSALYVEHLKAVPRVVDLVVKIQKHYPIYAVSNGDFGSSYVVRMLQSHYGINFRGVFISWEIGLKKPGLLKHVADALKKQENIVPEECIYVDDLEQYINAARELGMQTIQFDATYESASKLKMRLKKSGVLYLLS